MKNMEIAVNLLNLTSDKSWTDFRALSKIGLPAIIDGLCNHFYHISSSNITLSHGRINIDATSRRCIDADATLHKCHVIAGINPAR